MFRWSDKTDEAIPLRDVPEVDQHLPQFFPRLSLEIQRRAKFLLVHQAAFQKNLSHQTARFERLDSNTQ